MPWTDDMHVGFGEVQPARCLIGHDPLLDFRDCQSLAHRTSLVEAIVAVGEVLSFVVEDTDLAGPDSHNASVTIFEFSYLADEMLIHSGTPGRNHQNVQL